MDNPWRISKNTDNLKLISIRKTGDSENMLPDFTRAKSQYSSLCIGRSASGEAMLEAVPETIREHISHFEIFDLFFDIYLKSTFVKAT